MRSHDASDCCAAEATGLAEALIFEIADRLQEFATTGKDAAIDLRGLPMTEADREALATRLGRGEVQAVVEVAGRSEVWETAYSGVWWVRHLGADGQVAAEEIAITRVPAFLASHPEDVRAAAQVLRSECLEPSPRPERDDSEQGEGTHA
ncbi:MAG: hydrogenase expression/formation C-terminal domain-containing protein [Hyphomicrobiaceae bacterium]